jgi:hypothetical protein
MRLYKKPTIREERHLGPKRCRTNTEWMSFEECCRADRLSRFDVIMHDSL